MKIYLLMEPDYEGDHFYGAFSSKEKAMGSLAYYNLRLNENNIVEEEVDPPDEGRRYETIKTCFVYADGTIERSDYWGDYDDNTRERFSINSTSRASKEIIYGWGDGRTDQEAEDNARRGLALFSPVWGVTETYDGKPFEHEFHAPQCIKWGGSYAVHPDLNVARTEWAEFKRTGQNRHGVIVVKP